MPYSRRLLEWFIQLASGAVVSAGGTAVTARGTTALAAIGAGSSIVSGIDDVVADEVHAALRVDLIDLDLGHS